MGLVEVKLNALCVSNLA